MEPSVGESLHECLVSIYGGGPFYFTPRDGTPLFLGGIVKPEGFSILTQPPVESVASIHDRSPVMVPAENAVPWLDPDIKGTDALAHFAPAAHGRRMTGWRVGDGAQQVTRDDATLIEPVVAADG